MNGSKWVKGLALGSALLFASLTGYTLNAMLNLQEDLSQDLGENMVWAAAQASHQASLLHQIELAPGHLKGHHGNAMVQRALLRGRLEIFLAPTQAAFMKRAGVLDQLLEVKRMVHSEHPDFGQVQMMIYDIGRQIMQAERVQTGERRDAYKRLLHQLILFLYGVMASGGVLCWQLLRSLKKTREAYDEVARQHAQARELLEALERERAARMRYRDFVSVMSHQLRTPLSVIDSSAQRLMRQEHNSDGVQPNIGPRSQRIRRSVRQLNQLIARVLQGLRVDEQNGSTDIALEIVRCDWQEVINQALDGFGELLTERPLNLHWADGVIAPLWVECDRMWCAEILSNLISNADKYSPPGTPIDIHIDSTDGMLCCEICDSGPGLPEQDIERLFERFFQGHSSQRSNGVGLGLSIARTLAHWHQGSLSAYNRSEGGACFSLKIPLRRSEIYVWGGGVNSSHTSAAP